MKCVGCNTPATIKCQGHPMCEYHADLFPKSPKTHLRHEEDHNCEGCGSPTILVPWNHDIDIYYCNTWGCIEWHHPQGSEPRSLKGVMAL